MYKGRFASQSCQNDYQWWTLRNDICPTNCLLHLCLVTKIVKCLTVESTISNIVIKASCDKNQRSDGFCDVLLHRCFLISLLFLYLRPMLPHWHRSVHVSFGLNLGQIGGSEPKILGSCHPQTGGWSGQQGPPHVSLSQSGPCQHTQTSKHRHTQPLVRRQSLVPLHLQSSQSSLRIPTFWLPLPRFC